MADDIIAKCIAANEIDNGGIIVGAPKATDPLGSIYQINTYSSTLPATGTIFTSYDTRFTGVAPCTDTCGGVVASTGGMAMILYV